MNSNIIFNFLFNKVRYLELGKKYDFFLTIK